MNQLTIILQQHEPHGSWSARIDNGGGDSDYKYGICIGSSAFGAVTKLFDKMADKEIENHLVELERRGLPFGEGTGPTTF